MAMAMNIFGTLCVLDTCWVWYDWGYGDCWLCKALAPEWDNVLGDTLPHRGSETHWNVVHNTPRASHTHIQETRHLAQGKHTDTHINALTHTHTQTHEHTNTHKYTIANTHTHNELQRLCRMDCLLCGVMFDNQVCNLLPSYRGPLRCIRLIYGQLYLTIIAILQNMCTGIPSHTCLHTTSSMLFLFPPIPTFPHLNGRWKLYSTEPDGLTKIWWSIILLIW